MANKKDENKKKSNSNRPVWSLNKISFWLIVAAAILLLVAIVFKFIPAVTAAAGWMLSVVTAIMTCVVAVLAYRFVRNKPVVWTVLYIIVLLVVVAGIIIPAI